ncbi:hypothetical protein HX062_03760 [Myroides sp. DF42-4-2]|nr:hypothetical protein [Myroides sp. NP-2]MDM1406781.1 hypothetical protein [Myroides sp. DF42-4-2]
MIVCKWLPKNIAALTLYPFVIYKKAAYAEDPVLVNHERIHLKQQIELLIIPFYLWYAIEFILRFLYCRNSRKAYRAISFEREAYEHEADFSYLEKRKCYNFLRKR